MLVGPLWQPVCKQMLSNFFDGFHVIFGLFPVKRKVLVSTMLFWFIASDCCSPSPHHLLSFLPFDIFWSILATPKAWKLYSSPGFSKYPSAVASTSIYMYLYNHELGLCLQFHTTSDHLLFFRKVVFIMMLFFIHVELEPSNVFFSGTQPNFVECRHRVFI